MNYQIHHALSSLRPDAEFVVVDNSLLGIDWHDQKQSRPTDDEINAELARLQTEYTAQEYARNRAAAYPSTGNQFDMQYWDTENGTTTWADAIAAVKAEHPKP